MKYKSLAAIVIVCSVACGQASAVTCDPVLSSGKRFTVCKVDLQHEHLQLFLRDENGQPFQRFDALNTWLQGHGKTLRFAMNAGMYQADLSPVGLFRSDGADLAPLNVADGFGNFYLKPNGVFFVSAAGAGISKTTEFGKLGEGATLATQSGPMLVIKGKIHPAFKPDSTSRNIRNGVGIVSASTVVFAISDEPVTFYETAVLFQHDLHCADALYLDGAISGLYSRELRRSDQRGKMGPIIGVVDNE